MHILFHTFYILFTHRPLWSIEQSLLCYTISSYCVCSLSHVQLFVSPWTGTHQAPLPGDLPDLGIKTLSPASPAMAGGYFTTESAGKPKSLLVIYFVYISVSQLKSPTQVFLGKYPWKEGILALCLPTLTSMHRLHQIYSISLVVLNKANFLSKIMK